MHSVTEVNNLSKTSSSRGAELRFIGGVLDGHRCFVCYDDSELSAAGMPAGLVERHGGALRVNAAMAKRAVDMGLTEGSEYRKLKVRLASPSALLDETIMVDSRTTDEQAKQLLANMVGIRLPALHMFSVKRSSLVSFIAWDMDSQTMDVGMKSGSAYRYFNVDRMMTMEFLAADSLGNFYTTHIRPLRSVKLGKVHEALP